MTSLHDIDSFLQSYLSIGSINDGSWNGIQIEGKQTVKKIAFAVDAGIEIFQKALDLNADMLIVHHGIFWKGSDPCITGWLKKRIDLLYKNNITLYALHAPLDKHKEVGNNAQLLSLLGATIEREFAYIDKQYIGWIGKCTPKKSLNTLVTQLNTELKTDCKVVPFGPAEIETIAVCSGGGGYGRFFEAQNQKVDLYITGDSIDIYQAAKDFGINVIFGGHNATETVGLKALMKVLENKFPEVTTEFLDFPTQL
jgi:dinuclear metal center YbgI/SA1388 family protein